jgi:hypothetical protein
MMFQWQKGLLELHDEVVGRLHEMWAEHVPGYTLNENGLRELKKLSKAYSVGEVIAAIRIAADQYLDFHDEKPTKESVELAWKKVSGICRMNRLERDNPDLKRLYYIRGIVRNRLHYCNDGHAIGLLRRAYDFNASLDSLEQFAKTAKNWTEWRNGMENYIAQHDAPDPDEPATQEDGA